MDFRMFLEEYKTKVNSARSPVEYGESRIDIHLRGGRVLSDVIVVNTNSECVVVAEFTGSRQKHILALSDISSINPHYFYRSFVGWS